MSRVFSFLIQTSSNPVMTVITCLEPDLYPVCTILESSGAVKTYQVSHVSVPDHNKGDAYIGHKDYPKWIPWQGLWI